MHGPSLVDQARCAGWDLWVVRYATMRQTAWCARPKGTPVATINADSPEALIAEIREQETKL